jgi:hypothetical protein
MSEFSFSLKQNLQQEQETASKSDVEVGSEQKLSAIKSAKDIEKHDIKKIVTDEDRDITRTTKVKEVKTIKSTIGEIDPEIHSRFIKELKDRGIEGVIPEQIEEELKKYTKDIKIDIPKELEKIKEGKEKEENKMFLPIIIIVIIIVIIGIFYFMKNKNKD